MDLSLYLVLSTQLDLISLTTNTPKADYIEGSKILINIYPVLKVHCFLKNPGSKKDLPL